MNSRIGKLFPILALEHYATTKVPVNRAEVLKQPELHQLTLIHTQLLTHLQSQTGGLVRLQSGFPSHEPEMI
jgi:hypothetical protein